MRGLWARARANETSCFCPVESELPRSLQQRIEALRQRSDEVGHVHLFGGALHPLARDPLGAQADVVADGAAEQERILQHHAAAAAQLLQVHLAHVHAVDAHCALLHVVKAQQQEMSVVLPAPVWPTMATVSPGSMAKETPRRTQSHSWAALLAVQRSC
jgi:hypothetical protein